MIDKSKTEEYFNIDGHLNELGIALYVEFLENQQKDDLPDSLKKHVEDCFECKLEIMASNDILFEKSYLRDEVNSRSKYRFLKERRQLYFAIAALFIALISFAWYFVFEQQTDPDSLFDKYYEAYPDMLTGRGGVYNEVEPENEQNNNDTIYQVRGLKEAMLYYTIKEYDSAAILLSNLANGHKENVETLLYLGNAYLGMGKAEDAIEPLKNACIRNSRYQIPARWYLALAYLKTSELGKADTLLKEIANENGKFGKLAKELLLKLD